MSEWTPYLLEVSYWRQIAYAACAVAALLGIYEVCVLFRRGKGKRGFIAQRAENGEIAISVKTIEALVIKCAQKHGEIKVQSVSVEEQRSGLLIKLRTALPSGMNIPLAVGTLQKQIQQYITACSGVDVSEVRVKVDSTDKSASGSVYAVPDESAALPVDQPEPAPVPVEAVTPVEVPAEVPETPADARELLTHQRLFAAVEEPAMVPEPPVVEEPAIPSAEEGEAEVHQAAEEAAEEVTEPDTEWMDQSEAHWEAAADEAEAHEPEWEVAAGAELVEPAEDEATDEEKETTEE